MSTIKNYILGQKRLDKKYTKGKQGGEIGYDFIYMPQCRFLKTPSPRDNAVDLRKKSPTPVGGGRGGAR
jgi:hypothetical protein